MAETTFDSATFVKWLKILLCAAIVDAVAATLSHFSSILTFLTIWPANLTFLTTWPAALAGLVKTLVLLRLCTLNVRYKKAGIFRLCALFSPWVQGFGMRALYFPSPPWFSPSWRPTRSTADTAKCLTKRI